MTDALKHTCRLMSRARKVQHEKGTWYCIQSARRKIFARIRRYYSSCLELHVYKIFMRGTFVFQGYSYSYFYHKYNMTWKGERVVEIPIVKKLMDTTSGRILEVGNVLSHYFNVGHDIVDKYEKGENVINEDIVNFRPHKKYDLIISISTLEHVGWDETEREPSCSGRKDRDYHTPWA